MLYRRDKLPMAHFLCPHSSTSAYPNVYLHVRGFYFLFRHQVPDQCPKQLKNATSVLMYGSSDGTLLPPYVIYQEKYAYMQ